MTHKSWFALAALLSATGLIIGAIAIFSGNFSPRRYVESNYERAATYDVGDDARAYRSSKAPAEVLGEITSAWSPAARHVDGSGAYLQYADDAVVIFPLEAGSLILLEKLATAYPRYHSTVAGYWGWKGGSSGYRGGGPGSGK